MNAVFATFGGGSKPVGVGDQEGSSRRFK